MNRSLNKLRSLVHGFDDSSDRIAGGFGNLKGGISALEAGNPSCTNKLVCSNTNVPHCTNSGICTQSSDTVCTNVAAC